MLDRIITNLGSGFGELHWLKGLVWLWVDGFEFSLLEGKIAWMECILVVLSFVLFESANNASTDWQLNIWYFCWLTQKLVNYVAKDLHFPVSCCRSGPAAVLVVLVMLHLHQLKMLRWHLVIFYFSVIPIATIRE